MNAMMYLGLAALENPPRCRWNRRGPYGRGGVEPRLGDLLSDPLTHAVMRRDRVSPGELRAVVQRARDALRNRKEAA